MFFKIIFLLIILFLFFRNKNIESFSGCLPRYYNEHVEIDTTSNGSNSGFLRKSNDDEVIINPVDSSDNISISRDNIENIRIIDNCPHNSRDSNIYNTREIFMDMGIIEPDNTPCDITDDNLQKIQKYNQNNWISEEYKDPSNYCKTNDNIKCNKINYDFDCNEINNESYDSYDHIDYCDNLYDEENNILQYTSQDCINSCENSNQIFLDSLTPAEIQAHSKHCSDVSDEISELRDNVVNIRSDITITTSIQHNSGEDILLINDLITQNSIGLTINSEPNIPLNPPIVIKNVILTKKITISPALARDLPLNSQLKFSLVDNHNDNHYKTTVSRSCNAGDTTIPINDITVDEDPYFFHSSMGWDMWHLRRNLLQQISNLQESITLNEARIRLQDNSDDVAIGESYDLINYKVIGDPTIFTSETTITHFSPCSLKISSPLTNNLPENSSLTLKSIGNCLNFCNGDISGTLFLCSEESKHNHISKLREIHNNDANECDETGLNSSWTNFLNNGNTTCGCINRNTFHDAENKAEKVNKAIQQQMKKNCYTLGDKCKGFSYKIEEDLTSQIVEFSNNEFVNDDDHRITYNGSYFNECQLNNHMNYDTENTTVKTFVKKNLSSNDNMCES